MRKTTILSVVLSLLIVSPALARAHQHRHANVGAYGYADQHYSAPAYSSDLPFAPF